MRTTFFCMSTLLVSVVLSAQDVNPTMGQGSRASYRIVDERGVEWGQMAVSSLLKAEGGYSGLIVFKAGSDFLIARSDLPDDPMDFYMNSSEEMVSTMEYHLRGKVYRFALRSSKLKVVLLPEGKLENADAYQFILDRIYRDGGQLFFDFEHCIDYPLEGETASTSEVEDEPKSSHLEETDRPGKAIEELCSARYIMIESDIPCSALEGSLGLSCKEIDDAMYCRDSLKIIMDFMGKGKIKEFITQAVDDFDRCKKDPMYFKITLTFLMLSKNGKWYTDQFEQYLDRKKIDPLNYTPPKKPMYSDLCFPLRSYLLVKQKLKGLAVLDKACEGAIPSDLYILELAREGQMETASPEGEVQKAELFKLLMAFASGEKVADGLLTMRCDTANPRCHFRLALSRIAQGRYDPADFYEFCKYYPLFCDLVRDLSVQREQAIRIREKVDKEKAAQSATTFPQSP